MDCNYACNSREHTLSRRGFLITAADDERLVPESSLVVEAGIIDARRWGLNLVDAGNRSASHAPYRVASSITFGVATAVPRFRRR